MAGFVDLPGYEYGKDAYHGGATSPGFSQVSYSPDVYGSGVGMLSSQFNPNQGLPGNWPASPQYQYESQQWWLPRQMQNANQIAGMTPNPTPYWNQAMGYANQAANQAATQYGGIAQQFGNQMFNQLGSQWNSQLASNPAYAQWQSLLKQQGNEASGSAPQYLQDYWARSANARLGSDMGAFAAPSSQFAANQFGRLNADMAQQYHQQAMQNLGGTISQGNSYFNPYLGSVANTMGNIYSQGIGNAANQGFQFGNQAYQNAVAPYQQAQNKLVQQFV